MSGSVLGSHFGKVIDEGFDLLSAGLAEGFGATEISGIGLNEGGIEPVLANQLAESVP